MVYGPGPINPGSLKPVEHSGTQPLISLSDGDALAEDVVAAVADPGATDEAGVPPPHAGSNATITTASAHFARTMCPLTGEHRTLAVIHLPPIGALLGFVRSISASNFEHDRPGHPFLLAVDQALGEGKGCSKFHGSIR